MSCNPHKAMDWYSWLSKTGLDPNLVYDYSHVFSQNELQQEDVAYFNHEFLQSMGISIAKHRLEILKLARKERGPNKLRPISRFLIAITRTKKTFVKYIQTLVHRDHSAIVLVPKRSYSSNSGWRGAMLKRNSMSNEAKQGRLLLTNGSPTRSKSFSSPMVYDLRGDERMEDDEDEDDDGYYYRTVVEEIRWDAMFQNLKPT